MSKNLIIKKPKGAIDATVKLTGSKSESNRALILNALSKGSVRVKNLSEADDTVVLKACLDKIQANTHNSAELLLDIGPAGTAMRFLSSFLAVSGQKALLTGSARMKQRPIGILVDALRTLGANIEYAEAPGFPPLRFQEQAFEQASQTIKIKGDISSQYITSLILIAASLPHGLTIEIEGELTSRPYVEMSLGLLKDAGVEHNWEGNSISIAAQSFHESCLTIEPDWSAASYWYSIVALSDNGRISLPFLKETSLQGDSQIADIMSHFGVQTTYGSAGIEISKVSSELSAEFFDLKECPDLAQTIIVCAAALGKNMTFTGLETLRIKETDRISALQNELEKIGIVIHEDGLNYHLDCSNKFISESIRVKTYEDHRMAMAFAPLCMVLPQLEIEDPEVVGKSYPDFWKHLGSCGFIIE